MSKICKIIEHIFYICFPLNNPCNIFEIIILSQRAIACYILHSFLWNISGSRKGTGTKRRQPRHFLQQRASELSNQFHLLGVSLGTEIPGMISNFQKVHWKEKYWSMDSTQNLAKWNIAFASTPYGRLVGRCFRSHDSEDHFLMEKSAFTFRRTVC